MTLREHVLRQSLRAERAELRLLEASTEGVEARRAGLQDSLAAALRQLDDLKQELEQGRGARAEAQKNWAEARQSYREEQSRILRSQVHVLQSWNASNRGRLQRLRQYRKPARSIAGELRAELEGHLRWMSSSSRLPTTGKGMAGTWASSEKAAFDLRCWQQALRGLRQALQQASGAIDSNEEQGLQAALLEADDTLRAVLSLFQALCVAVPLPAEGWQVTDVTNVAQLLQDQVELEKHAAAHAAKEAMQAHFPERASHNSSAELLEKELLLEQAQEEEEEEELRHSGSPHIAQGFSQVIVYQNIPDP